MQCSSSPWVSDPRRQLNWRQLINHILSPLTSVWQWAIHSWQRNLVKMGNDMPCEWESYTEKAGSRVDSFHALPRREWWKTILVTRTGQEDEESRGMCGFNSAEQGTMAGPWLRPGKHAIVPAHLSAIQITVELIWFSTVYWSGDSSVIVPCDSNLMISSLPYTIMIH